MHPQRFFFCTQSSVLTSTPAAVCQCQCFILAARPLQLTAGLIAPPVRAAHRPPLRPRADDATVTVSVSDQPLQWETQQRVGTENITDFTFHTTWQIHRKITDLTDLFSFLLKKWVCSFLFGSFSFTLFLVSLRLNKGCIQLDLRWCQSNVQTGLRGHLPILLKTFLRSLNTGRLLPFFV